MIKLLSKFIFSILGWRIISKYPYPKKCVIIAAPHTSNWDFFYGRCYAYIVGIKPYYLIKSELFVPVIGWLLKVNGGIPVYRSSTNNFVDQAAKKFQKRDNFILGMSPEGTRKRVERWKSGFYYIALKAQVPIIFVKIDYKTKEVGVFNQLQPSGDYKKDLLFIKEQFSSVSAKIPENYNTDIK